MAQHFWLICGLWCGVGNAIFMRRRLQRHVAIGEFKQAEVSVFLRGLALWILAPCALLWALQLSIGPGSTPDFLAWPAPQRFFALSIQALVWASLLYWVFVKGGARTLSDYYGAGSKLPAFVRSPTAIKLGTVAAVAAGAFALLSKHA